MAQSVNLTIKPSALMLIQDKPCYAQLIESIQDIWNKFCALLSELMNRCFYWERDSGNKLVAPLKTATLQNSEMVISSTRYNLAVRNQNCFCYTMRFLEPMEVAQCETVCKAWKIDRVWQAQGINYGMTQVSKSGRFKDLFKEIHEMAFGTKQWREYLEADAGVAPRFSVQVYKAANQLKDTHTLTLIPKTVNGQPLSLNTFSPFAERVGMKYDFTSRVSEEYKNDPVNKSFWVWMQKEIEPGSKGKTQAQAKIDYPQKLGKALWIVVSTVAYYARHEIDLFPVSIKPWVSTWTRDEEQDPYQWWSAVFVTCTVLGIRRPRYGLAPATVGVVPAFPA